MEKEEIINQVKSLVEHREMHIEDISQELNMDIKTIHAAISRSHELVITGYGQVHSRKWYNEKRSYMDKVLDNIINKIK